MQILASFLGGFSISSIYQVHDAEVSEPEFRGVICSKLSADCYLGEHYVVETLATHHGIHFPNHSYPIELASID